MDILSNKRSLLRRHAREEIERIERGNRGKGMPCTTYKKEWTKAMKDAKEDKGKQHTEA